MKERRKRGKGCIYRPKGSANWWIKYRLNGKVYALSSGSPDETVAEELLEDKLARKRLGQLDPGADKVSFEDMMERMIAEYKKNRRSCPDRVVHSLKHLRPYFGGRKAQTITGDTTDDYILERQDQGAANATINRELATLRHMFNLSIKKSKIYYKPHISMLQEDNIRTGFFELGEFLALREALPEYLRPIVTFTFYTGWRKQEILSLKWNQVDLQTKTVRLEPGTTKNKKGRTIVLEGELLEVIQRQWERRKVAEIPGQFPALLCPYVFHHDGKAIRDFRAAWESACKATGLTGKLFHDFRRTAVRNMIRAGVSQTVAKKISGHKTDAVFQRYDITSEDDLREAARKTALHVETQKTTVTVVPLVTKMGHRGKG